MAITQSKYEGDFFVFENKPYTWQGSELGVSVSAENTWRLPVRVGLIGGELGITVYRFVGDYFYRVGPSPSGYFSCSYHPTGFCYLQEGEHGLLDMRYSWIKYDLSKIKKP